MKLSDCLKTKKIVFKNGKVESVSSITDGDIEFYELNGQRLIDIKENKSFLPGISSSAP